MKKQLGILTSVLMLCVTAFGWAGQNRGNYYDDGQYADNCCPQPRPVCRPVCPEPCAPKPVCAPPPCHPVCAPRPVCPPPQQPCPPPCGPRASAKQFNTSRICNNGVIVTATQPQLCYLGDNYALDLRVEACADVCHVDINAILPDGVTLVRSEPLAAVSKGNTLNWSFDAMKKGEVRNNRIVLRADREGDLCVCFCVTATPVAFCALLCAHPILECTKCGPEQVCPGDPVHYEITVTNKGSCEATEVVLTELVPDGLQHESGLNTLTYKLGTIGPCETKKVSVCFTATKRGKVCNRIQVTACNANPTSCEFCTCICCCLVDLVKTGPKEVPIGKVADYVITLSNPGDLVLTDVVLTDHAPEATSIVSANGAAVNGNNAVWTFPELKPGEKRTFNISLTTCTPGYFVNRVDVDNCQHCRASAEFGTRWKGRPALNLCLDSSDNPICIGQPVTYSVKLTNQGSEEDTNVKLVVDFPKEISPINGYGASKANVNGSTVTFDAIPVLGPRQSVEYRIDAKGVESGDARIRAKASSDAIKTPITEEESTIVN